MYLFVYLHFTFQELERPKDADPYQELEPLKKKVSHFFLLIKTFKGYFLPCSGIERSMISCILFPEKAWQEKEFTGKVIKTLTL